MALCGFFQVTVVHVQMNLPRAVWLALQDYQVFQRSLQRFAGFRGDGFGDIAALISPIACHLSFQWVVLDLGRILLEKIF